MMKFFKTKTKVSEAPQAPVESGITVNPDDDQKHIRNINRVEHIKATLSSMPEDSPKRRGFELELRRREIEIEQYLYEKEQEVE